MTISALELTSNGSAVFRSFNLTTAARPHSMYPKQSAISIVTQHTAVLLNTSEHDSSLHALSVTTLTNIADIATNEIRSTSLLRHRHHKTNSLEVPSLDNNPCGLLMLPNLHIATQYSSAFHLVKSCTPQEALQVHLPVMLKRVCHKHKCHRDGLCQCHDMPGGRTGSRFGPFTCLANHLET